MAKLIALTLLAATVSLTLVGRHEETRFLVVVAGLFIVLGRLDEIQKRLDER